MTSIDADCGTNSMRCSFSFAIAMVAYHSYPSCSIVEVVDRAGADLDFVSEGACMIIDNDNVVMMMRDTDAMPAR